MNHILLHCVPPFLCAPTPLLLLLCTSRLTTQARSLFWPVSHRGTSAQSESEGFVAGADLRSRSMRLILRSFVNKAAGLYLFLYLYCDILFFFTAVLLLPLHFSSEKSGEVSEWNHKYCFTGFGISLSAFLWLLLPLYWAGQNRHYTACVKIKKLCTSDVIKRDMPTTVTHAIVFPINLWACDNAIYFWFSSI